jgi:hypothetical protein
MLTTILLVFAFVLFFIAAFAWQPLVEPYRIRLIAAGLTVWVASVLFVGMRL